MKHQESDLPNRSMLPLTNQRSLSTQGDYAEASKYFSKAYSISQSLKNQAATESSGVYCGVSNALTMMNGIRGNLVSRGKLPMSKMLAWKNQRETIALSVLGKAFLLEVCFICYHVPSSAHYCR